MSTIAFRSILSRHPRQINQFRVIAFLAGNLALAGLMLGILHAVNSPWSALLNAPLFAIFSFRCFGLMHECVHAASLRSARLNLILGWVTGLCCFLPFRGWRDMHIEHHRWTGNIDKDPTSEILVKFEKSNRYVPGSWNLAWYTRIPLIALLQHMVFWKATVNRREFPFLVVSALYLLSVAWLLGPLTLATGLITYLALVEVVNLPHHLGMRQYRGEVRFNANEQNQFTRSCTYPKWFAHNVLLNFNLHTAHHMFPAHPWYQLDALHDEIVAAGMQLNMSADHSWTARNRKKSFGSVMSQTFDLPPASGVNTEVTRKAS